ncbi:MAG: hypothetical protein AB7O28_03845 [Vicinamibacterales bacterium]
MAADTYNPPESLSGLQSKGMIAAVIGAVLAGLGFAMSGLDRFYEAYLVAWVAWTGMGLGSLALLMLHHLSGGAWGVVIRRILEAAARTLPAMAVLGLPILAGMGHLYHWSHADVAAADPVIRDKVAYLNVPFFIARYAIFFAIWSFMAYRLSGWSAEQDRTGDPSLADKMARLSGGGLLVFGLTVTFAVVDWTMSVNPHWFSTMWGLLYVAGWGLSALAFAIFVLALLSREKPMDHVVNASHFHDLGKLLFAFIMLWAYLSFSQFLIIYSANTQEEIPHYWVRSQHGWQWVGWALVVFHFVLPYVMLLSRDIKRDWRRVSQIAMFVVGVRLVDYYWHVAPEFHTDGLSIAPIDVALPILLGGVFVMLFAMELKKRPLLPLHDAGLEKALTHHTH